MRQAEMKQVQTMPTAATDRLRTVCFSFMDTVTKTQLHWHSKRTLINVFLIRSKVQNIKRTKYSPWSFFSLAGPSSLSLLFPAPFFLQGTAEEYLFPSRQPASTCAGPVLHSVIHSCSLKGCSSKTGNTIKPVLTTINLILKFPTYSQELGHMAEELKLSESWIVSVATLMSKALLTWARACRLQTRLLSLWRLHSCDAQQAGR